MSKGTGVVGDVDVRDWDLKKLRRQFGMVLQDVHLFSGTIASNIRLGDETISNEAIVEAARVVNLNEWVATLPRGLDEEVAERGASMSAGQKQLVSFARALVHDPKILILDEATSSVDTHTEILVREALERFAREPNEPRDSLTVSRPSNEPIGSLCSTKGGSGRSAPIRSFLPSAASTTSSISFSTRPEIETPA